MNFHGRGPLPRDLDDQAEEGWHGQPRPQHDEVVSWHGQQLQQQQRPASASGSGGHNWNQLKVHSNANSVVATPPKRPAQRPSSAPAGPGRRKSGAVKPVAPNVNMNKAGGMGTAPRWTIGGRRPSAELREAAKSPGPGQYDLVRPDAYWCKKKPSHSLGLSRDNGCRSSPGPAPGDYSVRDKPRGPKWVIGEREHIDERPGYRTPGPGYYDLPTRLTNGRRMSSSPGGGPQPISAKSPGPGEYDFKADFTRQELPKHAFPRATRDWVLPKGPGPGAFDPNPEAAFLRCQPVYSMGKQYEEPDDRHRPKFVTYSQFA